MHFKKSKAVLAAIMAAAMTASAMTATVSASAATRRTKAEAFGDSTYAERYLSYYDDVITKGQDNGYLSKNTNGSSFGIPFHAREEVIIEAPDYGHETTSEAMSYIVWMAAMRDNIAANHSDQVSGSVTNTNDLAKAWKTLEAMIPTVQDNFWSSSSSISAQYCGEYDMAEDCPGDHASEPSKTASNPIYPTFKSAYSSDKGQYLMHWLADVENWYGYGSGTDFTFINTFQRGENESCWETVPHPCVEELEYGMKGTRGLKGIFNTDTQVAKQYAYTNAPDAEDRAIQAVFDSIKWGVDDTSVNALAAKMGDLCRNNMYDKYYQEIGENTSWSNVQAGADIESGKHYLMNWYTSWGGCHDGQNDWIWQIGCSHAHEFYQNPLAAYALATETKLSSNMKASGAVDDYTTSLKTQLEFYQWLQSSDGPIAGGATNSYKGRYEAYPSGVSTFNGMMYVEHPVYADPGSNHWIGNQVWAVQRLAELYYWCLEDNKGSFVQPGGVDMDKALEKILDKWVAWFVNNTVLTKDGDFYIPSNLDWSGQPDKWSGKQTDNTGLTCTITGYGNTDLGCVSSLTNTLIYYAKAKGVKTADIASLDETAVGASYAGAVDGVSKVGTTSYKAGDSSLPTAALYLAHELLDRQWEKGRDDLGMSRPDHNGSLARFFSQPVWVPKDYDGTMPNGDEIKNGIKFLDIRSMYTDASKCVGAKTSDEAIALVKKLKEAYDKDVANGAEWTNKYSASDKGGQAELEKFENVAAVDLEYHRFWHAGDCMVAMGVMANLYPDMKPGTVSSENPTDPEPTSEETEPVGEKLLGDVNCDGKISIIDVITLNKNLMVGEKLTAQGKINADVDENGDVDEVDSLNILKYVVEIVKSFPVK